MITGRVLQGFCNKFLKAVCLCIPLSTFECTKVGNHLGPIDNWYFKRKGLKSSSRLYNFYRKLTGRKKLYTNVHQKWGLVSGTHSLLGPKIYSSLLLMLLEYWILSIYLFRLFIYVFYVIFGTQVTHKAGMHRKCKNPMKNTGIQNSKEQEWCIWWSREKLINNNNDNDKQSQVRWYHDFEKYKNKENKTFSYLCCFNELHHTILHYFNSPCFHMWKGALLLTFDVPGNQILQNLNYIHFVLLGL